MKHSEKTPIYLDKEHVYYSAGQQLQKGTPIPMPEMYDPAARRKHNAEARAFGILSAIGMFIFLFLLFVAIGGGLGLVETIVVSTLVGFGVWAHRRESD